MTNSINTDERTFLVKFAWTISGGQFICTQSALIETIKKNDPDRGIEYIKEFDNAKAKFTRVSKKQLANYFSHNNEDIKEISEITSKY